MKNRFYVRRFLNKRGFHAGGYVLASVQDTSNCRCDRCWASVEFTVADCGRQISLDFDASPKELANSLHKVDLLLTTLGGLREALVVEGRLHAERDSRRKEAKAAKRSESVTRSQSVKQSEAGPPVATGE